MTFETIIAIIFFGTVHTLTKKYAPNFYRKYINPYPSASELWKRITKNK